jgi:AraC family transcriptional regulator
MDHSVSSKASADLPGKLTACSLKVGWRSLLLRAYSEPRSVEEFTTPATPDHLLVLVTAGSCAMESRSHDGQWQKATYRVGDIGMTAPGYKSTLRWRGETTHDTLQLHLPEATLLRVRDELSEWAPPIVEMPNRLSYVDPLLEQVMRTLGAQVRAGAPDLYAETAGELLAAHILVRHAGFTERRSLRREDVRLRRVEAFLRENLGERVTLASIAQEARLGRFQLLRLFKEAYGETPYRRLTRMRMAEACRQLLQSRKSVTEIAVLCSYGNPAHFTTAFRRVVGVSPNVYRRTKR